jgi:DNA-binding NtrC family response regulator
MQTLTTLHGPPVAASDEPVTSVSRPVRLLAAVDDDGAVTALQAALEDQDIQIVAEPRADLALARLRSERFQIVIGDLRPGRTDGVRLLADARRERPAAVRMLLAAGGEARELLDAIAATGVYRLLYPPVAGADLRAAIREALEQRAALARIAGPDRLTVNP